MQSYVYNGSMRVEQGSYWGFGTASIDTLSRAQFEAMKVVYPTELNINTRIFLLGLDLVADCQNATNTDIYFNCYETVFRRNSTHNTTALFLAGLESQLVTPTFATLMNFTPFDSAQFTQNVKVMRVRKQRMKVGERRCLTFKRKINKIWDYAELDSSATITHYRDMTRSFLFQIWGTPSYGIDQITETPTIVPAFSAMDVVWYWKLRFKVINIARTQTRATNNLYTSAFTVDGAPRAISGAFTRVNPGVPVSQVPAADQNVRLVS